jgi:GDP-mannose 6-dehydrogenase
MKISIFGLGYVGIVSAGCLAKEGHQVIGVDPNPVKVDLVNAGRSPVIEAQMDELVASAVASGQLRATSDAAEAIRGSELSLICVGTPSSANGSLNLQHVRNVCRDIGTAIKEKSAFHLVVMRSTMLPGSMRSTVIPELERASGLKAGEGFGVCNNPEFLREGTAVHDFYHPPKTVVGELIPGNGDRVVEIYSKLDAPMIRTTVDVAEMVKYVDNTWHALKVAFGNEIGRLCKSLELDSHTVMDIFVQDRKLNLSPAYLKPGFAFGGSCLPKDVRALSYMAKTNDVDMPIVNAILPSNVQQVELALQMVQASGVKTIGLLGLSFKAGTDDLRESPLVELVERLIGKGYDIRIFDRNVNLAHLFGANREYILNHIPHIAELFVDSLDAAVDHGALIIVGNRAEEFVEPLEQLSGGKKVLDLARLFDRRSDDRYSGLSW